MLDPIEGLASELSAAGESGRRITVLGARRNMGTTLTTITLARALARHAPRRAGRSRARLARPLGHRERSERRPASAIWSSARPRSATSSRATGSPACMSSRPAAAATTVADVVQFAAALGHAGGAGAQLRLSSSSMPARCAMRRPSGSRSSRRARCWSRTSSTMPATRLGALTRCCAAGFADVSVLVEPAGRPAANANANARPERRDVS